MRYPRQRRTRKSTVGDPGPEKASPCEFAVPGTRLAPQHKIVVAFLCVLVVVLTPREAFWAFGGYAALVLGVTVWARVSLTTLFRRLLFELPFVAFAVLLPILGRGPRVDVLGLSLSSPGLWAAWNLLVKGTLGLAVTGLLIATTPVADVLRGLRVLRLPLPLVQIAAFMLRYGEVLLADLRQMSIARVSRGDNPRLLWQAKAIARTAGALFLRSFERGERVYVAMLARGYLSAGETRRS
jgi:cobalt/nickel transport system permease protein